MRSWVALVATATVALATAEPWRTTNPAKRIFMASVDASRPSGEVGELVYEAPPASSLHAGLRLRGGNVVQLLTKQAAHQMKLQARRDIVLTSVCLGRMAIGLGLVFQPLVLMGKVQSPLGRATFQLFFSSQFYLRLVSLLAGQGDFFDTPKTVRGRIEKRGIQAGFWAASACAAHFWVGYVHEDFSPLRRALPLGLSLGVVVARTATSLYDYASNQVRERLRVVAAKRQLFVQHGLAYQLREMMERTELASLDPEEVALNEAADAAVMAVEKAIGSKTSAQLAARKALGQKLDVQLVRTAIAVFTTATGLKYATDGRLPWPLEGLVFKLAGQPYPPADPSAPLPLPSVTTLALYVPALVGAFEMSQGLTELLHLNEYYVEQVKVRGLVFALKYLVNPVLYVMRTAISGFTALTRLLGRARDALKHRLRGTGPKVKLTGAKKTPTQSLKVKSLASAKPEKNIIERILSAKKLMSLGKTYTAAVQAVQRQVQGVLQETKQDIWPWFFAAAGYQVQTGALSIRDVPGFLGRLSAAPVVAIAQLSGVIATKILQFSQLPKLGRWLTRAIPFVKLGAK